MHESPRIRRLRNDLTALHRLRSESSIFQFQAAGNPPNHYQLTLKGKGLCRDRGKIKIVHTHRVEIKLGASYPRTIPEIRWLTPIYHPNISEIGMVCLGGYGTHWVPSVQLDELCMMLWDMARYHNYDIRSPYNRDAALWVANQTSILFPTDSRPLRDLRVAQGRVEASNGNGKLGGPVGDQQGKSNSTGRRSAVAAGTGSEARTAAEPEDRQPWPSDLTAAMGSEARSAVERVRQFIGRYGRVFGEGFILEPDTATRDADSPVPGEPSPIATHDVQNDSAPAALNDRTLIGPIDTSRQEPEELVILEETIDPPAEPRRVPAGEEMIFIE
jgi:ubiquitin-protein ligase